jgi:hypothetical protein
MWSCLEILRLVVWGTGYILGLTGSTVVMMDWDPCWGGAGACGGLNPIKEFPTVTRTWEAVD